MAVFREGQIENGERWRYILVLVLCALPITDRSFLLLRLLLILLPARRAFEDFSCLIATSTALNQRETELPCQYLSRQIGTVCPRIMSKQRDIDIFQDHK